MTFAIAVLLRPLAYFVLFVLIVAPLTFLFYKIIPQGRFKVFLFKIRSGPEATRRDKIIMTVAVLAYYIVLFAVIGYLNK